MIAIVDYGAGNLCSVMLAFNRIGIKARLTSDSNEIAGSNGVVLPGVGSFFDAMSGLKKNKLVEPLLEYASSGRPLLGICLGMQMLFDSSEEGNRTGGLGLIKGTVKRLPDCGLKIPHIGWNSLSVVKHSALTKGLPDEPYTYFVHSFACYADRADDVLAITEYGVPFNSAVQRGNIMGVQFHPEKSYIVGQSMLMNFAAMAGEYKEAY